MTKYVFAIIALLLLIAVATTTLVFVLGGSGGKDAGEVMLAIDAPKDIGSGEDVVFTIKYQNGTHVPLNGVELFFKYPDGAVPAEDPERLVVSEAVGKLDPGQTGERRYGARIIGAKNATVQARAELSYESAGVARFQKTAETIIRIADTAFYVNVVVPQRAVSGERIVYFIDYTNVAAHAFPATVIEARYPEGFQYADAEPQPTKGLQQWDLGEVAQGGKGRITISGILTGNEGDTKRVQAEIGFVREDTFYPYTTASFDTIIAPPPLSVALFTDNDLTVVRRGQTVSFRLEYRNNAEVPISNAVMRAELLGDMFIPKSVSADKGFYDSTRNTVLWTPANVKELILLNPGDKYSVPFSVMVKDEFPIKGVNDTNFSLRVNASIESINVPSTLALNKIVSTASAEVKIRTDPQFNVWASYKDDGYGIINTGPMPPRVGQETRYTIHWKIAVPANDLENAEIRAILPTGVIPVGETRSYFTDAKPTADATTGEVVWFIPRIPANTGILSPAYEAVFQVALVPSITQLGQTVELMRASTLAVVDAFTGSTISGQAPSVRTDTLSDTQGQVRTEGIVLP